MKKTYIAPEVELVRLSSVSVIATSIQSYDDDENTITDTDITGGKIEFNSNAFQGGLFDEE